MAEEKFIPGVLCGKFIVRKISGKDGNERTGDMKGSGKKDEEGGMEVIKEGGVAEIFLL